MNEDKPVEQEQGNPNDLEFEMTPEQEQEYVDQILKDGDYVSKETENTEEVEKTEETEKIEEKTETVEKVEEVEEIEEKSDIPAPQTDDLWIEVEHTVTDDMGEEKTETIKLVYD